VENDPLSTYFGLKDCTISAIATGEQASSLLELRDLLTFVDVRCIFHHFWADLLRPKFIHPEFHNDFARWAHYGLRDNYLAERLGVIDPTDFLDLEQLRSHLIEIIESRIDEHDFFVWTRLQEPFYFMRSIIVVFDTSRSMQHPEELPQTVASLTPSSIFYHFIDARRRTPKQVDDFTVWLESFGDTYKELIVKIRAVDPYFLKLTELKNKLYEVVSEYFDNKKP
jgi:hypothetical protein